VLSARSLPTFRRCLLPPSSRRRTNCFLCLRMSWTQYDFCRGRNRNTIFLYRMG
jgi:hypothetical protein